MEREVVKIFDTTLRDGEQSPGATMNIEEKVMIARQLENLKVDVIEAGFADHLMFSADASSGYAKTVTVFLPKLKAAGATDEVLHKIMYDNPRRFLAFVPKRPRKH